MHERPLTRVLLLAVWFVLVPLGVEGLSRLAYRVTRGRWYSPDVCRSALLERVAGGEGGGLRRGEDAGPSPPGGLDPEVLHPYLGYVPDPASRSTGVTIGDPSQIVQRSEHTVIIGIFGGSFAGGVCDVAAPALQPLVAPPGRKVRVLCVASGGYKQPQQLLALAYILALGGQFDIVINIDGFNEVVLPPVENIPHGVSPVYPRAWYWRVGQLKDPRVLTRLGALYAVDARRASWAAGFLHWGLCRSSALSMVWEGRDGALASERGRLLAELQAHEAVGRESYAVTGPRLEFADDRALYDYLARVWSESSAQMRRLCEANGIEYYHFLQPNQYVDGSKPMDDGERKVAIRAGHPYQKEVVSGYPLLRRYGQDLPAAGVRFDDLTMVFAGIRDPLYVDDCCHVSPYGYRLVAWAIGRAIRVHRGEPEQPDALTGPVPGRGPSGPGA